MSKLLLAHFVITFYHFRTSHNFTVLYNKFETLSRLKTCKNITMTIDLLALSLKELLNLTSQSFFIVLNLMIHLFQNLYFCFFCFSKMRFNRILWPKKINITIENNRKNYPFGNLGIGNSTSALTSPSAFIYLKHVW